MSFAQRVYCQLFVFIGVLLFPAIGSALEFQPGVGAGLQYTDNARLAEDNKQEDVIAIGYVGASLVEAEGPLSYGATTSFNNQSYTQDTFSDLRYFNLAANADWRVVDEYFDLTTSDYYSQRPVRAINANTPDNIQDSNIFNFGAIFKAPISARQNFSLTTSFSQYYYEISTTDSNRYSLIANWNYQLTRLDNGGFNLSVRNVDYTERNLLGETAPTTTYTTASTIFSAQRKYSNLMLNLGATNVNREGGIDTTGFAGAASWSTNLSSRSALDVGASTDLTDTSRVTFASAAAPVPGNPDDVQLSTDVIRNTLFNLGYKHASASLKSHVWGEYRKVNYSDSPLDRVVRSMGVRFDYPFTQLLTSGSSASYNRTRQLDTGREDERYTISGNLNYNFSRKLQGIFDLTYRTKESTNNAQNYQEFTVFVNLVYGFNNMIRPSRSGGF